MKNNWPTKKLGEVANIYSGGTPRRSNPDYWGNDVPWLTMEDVNGNFEVTGTVQYISNEGLQHSNAQLVPVGSVNLSCTASVGNVTVNRIPLATNQQFNSLHPKQDSELSTEFLAYRLILDKTKVQLLGGSTTFQFISKGTISNFEIPIPDSSIQKKIIERLDAIRKAQELCDAQISKTEELFDSILAGELDSKNNWEIKRLGDICDVRDGTHDSPKYHPTGIPLITSKNLKDNEIDFVNVNYISEDDHKKIIKRSLVGNGDILYGMIGTIGNPVVVDTRQVFSIKNVGLIKFGKTDVNNYYIKYFLQSKWLNDQITKMSRGGTQKFVSLGNLRDLEIPVPPIEKQKQIVEKLDAIQDYKKLLLKQKSLLKELFDSVLYKSMNGEMD